MVSTCLSSRHLKRLIFAIGLIGICFASCRVFLPSAIDESARTSEELEGQIELLSFIAEVFIVAAAYLGRQYGKKRSALAGCGCLVCIGVALSFEHTLIRAARAAVGKSALGGMSLLHSKAVQQWVQDFEKTQCHFKDNANWPWSARHELKFSGKWSGIEGRPLAERLREAHLDRQAELAVAVKNCESGAKPMKCNVAADEPRYTCSTTTSACKTCIRNWFDIPAEKYIGYLFIHFRGDVGAAYCRCASMSMPVSDLMVSGFSILLIIIVILQFVIVLICGVPLLLERGTPEFQNPVEDIEDTELADSELAAFEFIKAGLSGAADPIVARSGRVGIIPQMRTVTCPPDATPGSSITVPVTVDAVVPAGIQPGMQFDINV